MYPSKASRVNFFAALFAAAMTAAIFAVMVVVPAGLAPVP
jgi:hypothetical protein